MNEQFVVDPDDARALIPFSSEQRQYLGTVVESVVRVVSGQKSLQEEENLFGEGRDKWPKMPGPVLYRYYQENPVYSGFAVSFLRRSDTENWHVAVVSVRPENYPHGLYLMELPATFFGNFELEQKYLEPRPNEAISLVNVFRFRPKAGMRDIRLQFDARPDGSSLADDYPKSFHSLTVTRLVN